MPRLETVAIEAKNPQGYKIINKSDFDPKVHKEASAKAAAAEKAAKAEKPAENSE